MTSKSCPKTIDDIEKGMSDIMNVWPRYDDVKREVERMLRIMGEVHRQNVVASVLTAAANMDALKPAVA